MAGDNPLIALGVPRHVLVLAVKDKNPKLALDIAEANYKTLAKKFHPDLPGGDADYMSALGDAMEEIRDLDALDYYLSELVGRKEVLQATANLTDFHSDRLTKDTESLKSVLTVFDNLDQFALLGIRSPVTFITYRTGLITVINVLNSQESELLIYNRPMIQDLESTEMCEFLEGTWKIKNLKKNILQEQLNTLIARQEKELEEFDSSFLTYTKNELDKMLEDDRTEYRKNLREHKQHVQSLKTELAQNLKNEKEKAKKTWIDLGEPDFRQDLKVLGYKENFTISDLPSRKLSNVEITSSSGNNFEPIFYSATSTGILKGIIFGAFPKDEGDTIAESNISLVLSQSIEELVGNRPKPVTKFSISDRIVNYSINS